MDISPDGQLIVTVSLEVNKIKISKNIISLEKNVHMLKKKNKARKPTSNDFSLGLVKREETNSDL